MRGDKEAECLDFIIQSIFYNKKGEVRRDCDDRSYLEVDEETFKKWWLYYADIPHNFKFGLTEDDKIEFLNAIRKANANNKSSEFPDYIFLPMMQGICGHGEIFQNTGLSESAKSHRIKAIPPLKEAQILFSLLRKQAFRTTDIRFPFP